MAGVEELGEPAPADLLRAPGPVQLKQLRCCEELVAVDVADNLDVAGLECAGRDRVAAAALDHGAVVALKIGVRGCGFHQPTSSKSSPCSPDADSGTAFAAVPPERESICPGVAG